MVTANKTLFQMESHLYDTDRWAWAIYTALRVAPTEDDKVVLWGLLNKDQKAALRIMAKHYDPSTTPAREAAQEPGK